MDNDGKQLDALTNQEFFLNLGGKSFSARRATLYDVGLLNKFIKKKRDEGDDANLDLDSSLYVLFGLINKEKHPELTSPDDLAKILPPFDGVIQLTTALEQVGFKVPQSLQTAGKESSQT